MPDGAALIRPAFLQLPHTQKSPSVRMGFFTCLMPGSLWRASCPPPSGPLLRNVQIRSRRICPPQESAHRQTTDKNKRPCLPTGPFVLFDAWQFPTLAWGDPTLPSALRRFTSEFGMGSGGTTALVPPGKFFVLCPVSFTLIRRWLFLRTSVTYFCMLLPSPRLPPCLSEKSFGL